MLPLLFYYLICIMLKCVFLENIFTDKTKCGNLARAILLTNRPLGSEELNSGGGGVMFMKLPAPVDSTNQSGGAHVIQLSHFSGTCPKGWCMELVTFNRSFKCNHIVITFFRHNPHYHQIVFGLIKCRTRSGTLFESTSNPFRHL